MLSCPGGACLSGECHEGLAPRGPDSIPSAGPANVAGKLEIFLFIFISYHYSASKYHIYSIYIMMYGIDISGYMLLLLIGLIVGLTIWGIKAFFVNKKQIETVIYNMIYIFLSCFTPYFIVMLIL